MHELTILDKSGDIKVTWDPDSAESRETARKEVARLKELGYLFFRIDGEPADEVSAGGGELMAKIITAEEVIEPEAAPAEEAPKRRGGRKGPRKTVATRPVQGG